MTLTEKYDDLHKRIHSNPRVFRKTGSYNGAFLISQTMKPLIDELVILTSFLNDDVKIAERIYCLNNHLYDYPSCKCGGKITTFYNESGRKEYGKYCSISCGARKEAYIKNQTGKKLSEETKNKMKATCLERHGVENYFQKKEFIENNYNEELVAKRDANRIVAVRKKYGVDNVFQLDETKEKIIKFNMDNYGVENHMHRHLLSDTIEKLNDVNYLKEMNEQYPVSYIAKELGIDSTTLGSYFIKHNIDRIYHNESYCETYVRELLENNNIVFIQNCATLFDNSRHHVDFYIPSHNLAIEVNGIYWHSEAVRPDKNYHQYKFDELDKKGIQLLQFWECDINNKFDVISSMILNKLGIFDTKIHARNCEVRTVNRNIASNFICNNHLQDLSCHTIHNAYGLYHNDNLVSVITFQITNKVILNRFCSLQNTIVVGGFSKLLKYAIKDSNYESITSYSDCLYSNGNLYKMNGFKDVTKKYTQPAYYYTLDYMTLLSRREFMKDKIKLNYPQYYDINKTERQMASEIGAMRVNGCIIKTWQYDHFK